VAGQDAAVTVSSPTSVTAEGLLGALRQLRAALLATPLPLEVPGVAVARASQRELVDQLDDYVLPRLTQIDAPLLAVVGGSTGAGKSTLVNSIVGARVSEPGVLRPTTRSPVLVHNPADGAWFNEERILPELARTTRASADPGALQLVPVDAVPAGLAILDAPDIDSVEQQNRLLATQLLAAADLWLFVTSAARYADQVPWDFLKAAAERSTAVAVVLDRTPPQAAQEVSGHLGRMLANRGLADARLFTVVESAVDAQGLLPPANVGPIRQWLHSLAADSTARAAVVRQTLDGAIRSLGGRTFAIADSAAAQADAAARLRVDADRAYADGAHAVDVATQDGTMLRGEVLARWQEFVGTGELLKTLEAHIGRLRDRLVSAFRGQPPPAQGLAVAVESSLETLIVEHAESAAERVDASWRSTEAGQRILEGADRDLGRASRDFRPKVERAIREWQHGVLEMVREEGADRRATARFLAYGVNSLGVALMIVVFAHTAGLTGAEVGVAGGTAVMGQKVLEAVFGDQAVRRLAEQAHEDLHRHVDALFAEERARFFAVLDRSPVDPEAAARLRDAARAVEHARLAAGAT
jgi:energy-coupling factor transporter ATP-binding protein EcfA2